jgi:hypothetical protein
LIAADIVELDIVRNTVNTHPPSLIVAVDALIASLSSAKSPAISADPKRPNRS